MTFRPEFTLEQQLPENVSFSEDKKQFLEQITKYYNSVARKVNEKERAYYPEEVEILNCQRYFVNGDPQTYRSVFRKVFPFGAIAAGAALNIVHGITGIVELTNLYGTCITTVVDYRPIPFNSVAAANQGIQVLLAGVNITITNGGAAPNITSGIIVCEYLKQ